MSGSHSRNKGANYERRIADRFREVYPAARRGIGQARSGGDVPDVDGTPYWCELKCYARGPSITRAYAQALKARDECPDVSQRGKPIIVVTHRDRGEDLVTLSLEDFLVLVTL